jgi:hypothetical protein
VKLRIQNSVSGEAFQIREHIDFDYNPVWDLRAFEGAETTCSDLASLPAISPPGPPGRQPMRETARSPQGGSAWTSTVDHIPQRSSIAARAAG